MHIDRDRLLADLEKLALFSDDTPPGISRLVFAEADQKSRAWLKSQCVAPAQPEPVPSGVRTVTVWSTELCWS